MKILKGLSKISYGGRKYAVSKKFNNDGSITYKFRGDSGDSQMTVYNVFPGIRVVHHAVHTDRSFLGTSKKGNVIEIHHCVEGRIEKQLDDTYFYLMPGDLAVDVVKRDTKEYAFPMRHYHGITISINVDVAPRCFSCFLDDVNVRPAKIAERLCGDKSLFVIRSQPCIEHIFSEMYNVPCKDKRAYYKIKVMELLLVLSAVDPAENRLSLYALSCTQVELAKKAATYISENLSKNITVSALSEKFNVSSTHLQNAFKGVYGVPVYSFVRVQKMNSAAISLVKTNSSVLEIANACGYFNASKFASAFREVMGETPIEYRKNHRLIVN